MCGVVINKGHTTVHLPWFLLQMYWEGLDVTEYVADLNVFLSDFFKFNFN